MQSTGRNLATILDADRGGAEDVRLVPGDEDLHHHPRSYALRLGAKAIGFCLLVVGCVAAVDAFRPSASHSQLRRTNIAAHMLAVEESASTTDAPAEAAKHKKLTGRHVRGADQSSEPSNPGWPCGPDEEIFFGDCYISCANATNGAFPFRSQPCTCATNQADSLIANNSITDCNRFKVDAYGDKTHHPVLPNCPYKNEELSNGLCFMKCSLMTDGKFPVRTGMNTCANGRYGGNWTMGFGPASGFGMGGTNGSPHIPKPTGIGYPADGAAGMGPVGWVAFPMPEATDQALKQLPPVYQEAANNGIAAADSIASA